MTAASMIERNEGAGAASNRYHYTRVVETAGRTVRVRVERAARLDQSLAVAEVLNHEMTWIRLAEDAPGNWWHGHPGPAPQR